MKLTLLENKTFGRIISLSVDPMQGTGNLFFTESGKFLRVASVIPGFGIRNTARQ